MSSDIPAPLRIFAEKDADPQALVGERIGVLGCGNLGRPFALNLRDSGVQDIVIGNFQDAYADQARAEYTSTPDHRGSYRCETDLQVY
ncbi:MAG: hypothetical protein C3F13_13150 [Anaerolineales bacterium]|nr:hypothetical protein [Anaerolineae bacterium]PWB51386.1 MAG: hypothetical protein C3F13_13150 [Anaerolineales bacterium]